MAKRELEAPGAGEELQTAKGRASDVNRREERCCQVYEEGVKNISTGWLPHILKKSNWQWLFAGEFVKTLTKCQNFV